MLIPGKDYLGFWVLFCICFTNFLNIWRDVRLLQQCSSKTDVKRKYEKTALEIVLTAHEKEWRHIVADVRFHPPFPERNVSKSSWVTELNVSEKISNRYWFFIGKFKKFKELTTNTLQVILLSLFLAEIQNLLSNQ